MLVKIREQAGTDAVRKFDYQMAVALDYLLNEFDNQAIILIETLEDFAVFRNLGTEDENIDIYQVKTKDKGLYAKSQMNSDNVVGKIILTDFYFDSRADSLNIVCNTSLKGTSTEELENFRIEEALTITEMDELRTNAAKYLKKQPDFNKSVDDYCGKLIYIRSSLPFSAQGERYEETLIGKTNNVIANYLNDEDHTINPKSVFNTLKLLIDRQRRVKIQEPEIELDLALEKKGIDVAQVREIIDKAAQETDLCKNEILKYASEIFSPIEYKNIKKEYPAYLSYRRNLTDRAFTDAKEIVETEYNSSVEEYDSLREAVRNISQKCAGKVPYYSLPVIQIITIVVVYS